MTNAAIYILPVVNRSEQIVAPVGIEPTDKSLHFECSRFTILRTERDVISRPSLERVTLTTGGDWNASWSRQAPTRQSSRI